MALLRNPQLTMLDEPSSGSAPVLVGQTFGMISEIHNEIGLGIPIADQDARRLVELPDHTFVLKASRIVSEGSASDFTDLDVLWSLF